MRLYSRTSVCYLRLDTLRAERIIKDVMMGISREEGEVKKSRQKVANGRETGVRNDINPTDTGFEEIDPADFFDPEEFGIRRPEGHPIRP